MDQRSAPYTVTILTSLEGRQEQSLEGGVLLQFIHVFILCLPLHITHFLVISDPATQLLLCSNPGFPAFQPTDSSPPIYAPDPNSLIRS